MAYKDTVNFYHTPSPLDARIFPNNVVAGATRPARLTHGVHDNLFNNL